MASTQDSQIEQVPVVDQIIEMIDVPFVPTKESLDELMSQIVEMDDVNESHIGQVITVAGWIFQMRWQKKLIFGKLCDSSMSRLIPLQVVFQPTQDPLYYASLRTVARGASIIVKGLIVKSPKSEQPIEMQGDQFYIVGDVEDPEHYPLAGTASSNIELLRGIPELEPFSEIKSTMYDMRSKIMLALDLFFARKKYKKVDLPVITFSECEGGCQPMQATLLLTENKKSVIPVKQRAGELGGPGFGNPATYTDEIDFSKDFFGAKASLTVSAQLELETQLPLGNVWTVTRAFRGEPSQTTRHLCEFSMIELEKRFSRSAKDIMDISEECIKFCLQYALTECPRQLEFLEEFYKKDHTSKLQQYVDQPFVRITHAQAVEILRKDNTDGLVEFKELPEYDQDMGSEHEKYLTDVKYKHPVIVTRYPKAVKAFYMPVLEETLEESHGIEHVDCFDILVPDVGELVGGSQRIYKLDELIQRIDELGLDKKPLQFYIDLRRYGSTPHGGMGMGFERLVKFITGAGNVKDCVAFPRFIGCGKQ